MKYLNISGLVLSGVFFVYAVATVTPASLSYNVQEMLASVGVAASVAPNPYNTVAQQLTNKETQLAAREAALSAQEKVVASESVLVTNNNLGFYSLCTSIVLVLLVAANFYFDVRRKNQLSGKGYSVNLR